MTDNKQQAKTPADYIDVKQQAWEDFAFALVQAWVTGHGRIPKAAMLQFWAEARCYGAAITAMIEDADAD